MTTKIMDNSLLTEAYCSTYLDVVVQVVQVMIS
jgi:hypothetical protein